MKLHEANCLVESLKMKFKLLEQQYSILSKEHQETGNKMLELEKFEEIYNKFHKKMMETIPDGNLEKFFQKFEYLENVCLDLTKRKLELEDDQMSLEKDKQKIKNKYDNIISDLNNQSKEKEKFIKSLQDAQTAKNLEFDENFSYKNQYMNLFKRIMQLYTKWSENLSVFSSNSNRIINTPEEILDVLDKMISISTPQSAQAYIRKVMASALRILRKFAPEKCNEIFDPERIYEDTSQYIDKLVNEIKKNKNEVISLKQKMSDKKNNA